MTQPESPDFDKAAQILDALPIEIPSWGFANTGTRFGKFTQPAAASTLEEKFNDAAEVHRLTGATPTLALHVLWDLPHGLDDISELQALERRTGIRSGSINPNLFQDQQYKFGSLCNPSAEIRESALRHVLDSIEIAKRLRSRDVSLWLADGSNYPGTQSIRNRIEWLEDALRAAHAHLAPDQRLLVEYKPFEPAFYHTDIADWGMSSHLCRVAGPQARRARRYRPSLPGAEHRADRGLAAAYGPAGRIPLQRPPLRRRRPHPGVDRSLPDVPDFP